jgi:hypothetical protein
MFLVLNNIIISQENRFRSLTRNSNQDGLYQEKIMTYNVLHYDGENDRDPFFKEIIGQIEPDLIVCQEINGVDGFNSFFDSVLNVVHPGIWDYADFIDQSANNDIALYFKSEHFSYVSTSMIYTAQTSGTRNVVEWFMVHNPCSMVRGLRSMVHGSCFNIHGQWSVVRGPWSMAHGPLFKV